MLSRVLQTAQTDSGPILKLTKAIISHFFTAHVYGICIGSRRRRHSETHMKSLHGLQLHFALQVKRITFRFAYFLSQYVLYKKASCDRNSPMLRKTSYCGAVMARLISKLTRLRCKRCPKWERFIPTVLRQYQIDSLPLFHMSHLQGPMLTRLMCTQCLS